jgi:trehalose 6-phosphate synthase
VKFLLRFLLPLAVILGGLAYGLLPLVDHLTTKWFVRDLDIRSRLILNAVQDDIAPLLKDDRSETRKKALAILKKTTQDDRLLALGVCSPTEQLMLKTELFPETIHCSEVRNIEPHSGTIMNIDSGDVHIAYGYIEEPLVASESDGSPGVSPGAKRSGTIVGKLILLHDMSYASRRSNDTKIYLFCVFLAIGLLIATITVLIARWSMATWVKSVRDLVGGIRTVGIDNRHRLESREFLPILKDLKGLVRDLESSAREKDESQITWDAKTLKGILTEELSGDEVVIVSNRQPYIHNRRGNDVEIQCPASGLVTALEPILKACSGVWIAHGNGTADRDVVDKRDRVMVPPGNPQYEIHRVWLTREEEQGYYYGFSNEGLWPLCHIAHTRPIFRRADWEQYVAVNSKFTDAVVKDAKTDDPVVLVQDYHFALVPKLLRAKLPKATIITFWHIPWPNPESFGICPWREEILDGLLGSSIIGFHTQFHCNNFIESVDRFLESRIDRETNSISYQGKITEIRPYPISIEWPPERLAVVPDVAECRHSVRLDNNLPDLIKLGVGIDRLDYTKGIIERFRAIERLLELQPKWIGCFSFIQLAAPSRSSIDAYQQFDSEVRVVAQQINTRFGKDGYLPIILKIVHHESHDVFRYLRAADLCVVSSLHDGMNLVAKEFVASRNDERGVLVLSMFAGASRELAESLIVNPYDADQTATALHAALAMSASEQQERMRALRAIVKEYNVYRWAGRMLLDAARVRRRNRFAKRVRKINDLGDELDGLPEQSVMHTISQMPGIGGPGVFRI